MEIIEMYVKKRMSITDIHLETGKKLSTIRYALKKAGVLRSRSDAIRLAGASGKLGSGTRGKTRVISDEWRKNISAARNAYLALNAKGTSLKPNGYIEYTRGKNKGRLVHVVAMESLIGRRLLQNEVVHHKDEDKTNNSIDNLQLMTRAEHSMHHAMIRNTPQKRKENGQFK